MPFVNNQWKPNRKQAEFLALPDTIREGFYGGGAGSGKSEVLLVYPLIRKYYENPRFKQVFMRRTYPELRNEIVPRSREFYLKFGAKFNKSEMSWTFPREDQYGSGSEPNGAVIYLGHCENEDDVHKYDSMEINLYTPDELTSFSEWIYLYIAMTRVRAAINSGLPSIIRSAGMPGGMGHTWVKKRFVDAYPKGGKTLVGKGGNKRIYIHSTLADNEYIDPNYQQSLEALPEAEKQAKKYGSWDAYLGQVFEEFRDRHYPDEPEHAVHLIDPFDIPDYWPKIISIDWGFAPPAATSIQYLAISPEHRVIAYEEDWFQKTKIEEWCSIIKPKVDLADPKVIKLCQSAGQQRGDEHTIRQQIESALGRSVDLTSNQAGSRVATKMLLHEYFRWTQKHKASIERLPYDQEFAEFTLRNHGVEAYHNYLASFSEIPDENNLPKLLIFKTKDGTDRKLVQAIKSCVYDKTNPQDVSEFEGDDPYDAIRYGVDAADRFFNEAGDAQKRFDRQQKLIAQLQSTGDMTAFYRNAKRIESEGVTMAVRRFHKGRRLHV